MKQNPHTINLKNTLQTGWYSLCQNYRDIALLDTTYKIPTEIIRNLENVGWQVIKFSRRSNCYTTARAKFWLTYIIYKFEQNFGLHIIFINYKQTYDWFDRIGLSEAVKTLRIARKLIYLVTMTLY